MAKKWREKLQTYLIVKWEKRKQDEGKGFFLRWRRLRYITKGRSRVGEKMENGKTDGKRFFF